MNLEVAENRFTSYSNFVFIFSFAIEKNSCEKKNCSILDRIVYVSLLIEWRLTIQSIPFIRRSAFKQHWSKFQVNEIYTLAYFDPSSAIWRKIKTTKCREENATRFTLEIFFFFDWKYLREWNWIEIRMYSNVGATGILIQNKSIASATHSTFQFIFEVVDICRESREKKNPISMV